MLLFALLLHWLMAVGQMQPMFQTTLFFEDAIGHKDTVTVGFDTLANSVFNPQFGEMDISTPFDSVFEVRATNWSSFGWGEGDYVLSKKIVSAAENNVNIPFCYSGGGVILFIHAKYQPFRVSWEEGVFEHYCARGSYFTPDRMHQMIEPWDWMAMPSIRFNCAAGVSMYELALGDEFRAPLEIPYIAMQEVEGNPGVLDSIYGLAFGFGIADGFFIPCSQVSTHENQRNEAAHHFRILPNPASDKILILNPESLTVASVDVYDYLGRMIVHYPVEQIGTATELDVSQIARGVYFVVQRYTDGQTGTGKMVKM